MNKIKWNWILIGVMACCLYLDIIEEGIMMIGVFLGWLVGLGTMSSWDIKRKKQKVARE